MSVLRARLIATLVAALPFAAAAEDLRDAQADMALQFSAICMSGDPNPDAIMRRMDALDALPAPSQKGKDDSDPSRYFGRILKTADGPLFVTVNRVGTCSVMRTDGNIDIDRSRGTLERLNTEAGGKRAQSGVVASGETVLSAFDFDLQDGLALRVQFSRVERDGVSLTMISREAYQPEASEKGDAGKGESVPNGASEADKK